MSLCNNYTHIEACVVLHFSILTLAWTSFLMLYMKDMSGLAEPVQLVRPKPDHYFVRPKPGNLVFYLQSNLWVNHTLRWSLGTTLLVTKNVDSANARIRWTSPSRRAGSGSGSNRRLPFLYTRNSRFS